MANHEATRIFLSLGSNLGEREGYLEQAILLLPPKVKVLETSSIYETAPWGYSDQPPFLNQVLKAGTALEPSPLLSYLKDIEEAVGREETFRYGPRVIDIDILFYGDTTYSGDHLVIPHPKIEERAFVLVPLAEIAPDLIHPEHDKSIKELLSEVDQSGVDLYSTSLE